MDASGGFSLNAPVFKPTFSASPQKKNKGNKKKSNNSAGGNTVIEPKSDKQGNEAQKPELDSLKALKK
jgi:hypothetical protein